MPMVHPDASHKVAHLLSLTGGFNLDTDHIEKLNDLEAGHLLLEWLAAQLPDSRGNPEAGDSSDEKTENMEILASLRDVALEKDEVLILNQIKPPEATSNAELHLNYLPPSRLKKHAEYVNNDINLVQRETDLLRARIIQTKKASKKITQSIEFLKRAVFDLDSKLNNCEERLSELAIICDTTTASNTNIAEDILRDLMMSEKNRDLNKIDDDYKPVEALERNVHLESARNLLLKIQDQFTAVTTSLRRSLEDFSLRKNQGALRMQDLQGEVQRLQNVFNANRNSVKSRRSSARPDDLRITEELEDICVILEREVSLRKKGEVSRDGALVTLLSELEEIHETGSVETIEVPVQGVLRNAWALDQAAILEWHEEVLDKALESLGSASSSLEGLHASISRLSGCVQSVEAVLEAFGEELGDIYLNDSSSKTGRHLDVDENGELEQQLNAVLNDLKDLRPPDMTPMVLLTQDDIMTELRSLKERSTALEVSEKKWADDIVNRYTSRPVHSALTQVYMDSPLNTSLPFAFPSDLRELEAQTRAKTTELQKLTSALEEEVRETVARQGNLKRLGSFIDKWS